MNLIPSIGILDGSRDLRWIPSRDLGFEGFWMNYHPYGSSHTFNGDFNGDFDGDFNGITIELSYMG